MWEPLFREVQYVPSGGLSVPGTPDEVSNRPDGAAPSGVDPFSDVFTAMRVRSALYCRMEATAPWGVRFPGSPHAKFGLVTRGSCWLEVTGEPKAIPLRGGDCYVVAAGLGVTVRDAPRTRAQDGEALIRTKTGDLLRFGGGGAATQVITGLFEFDAWSGQSVFELLPSVLCVRGDEAQASALGATLNLLALKTATSAIGSPVVINRLAEILFVQMIRAHYTSGGAGELGWLAALGNAPLGAALRAMHHAPAQPWSVEALARIAGMSRSAFALHFKAKVGETPLEYLTRWRMYKAGCLLRDGDLGLAEVADAVGYESAGAFNRAFQRVHARTPGEFRRFIRQQTPSSATGAPA
ncbi:AraC family transcriptional regulator [Myxococcus sp. CA040A]|uniref:AraC family transcriptional regulator n=1 Tax=Myxococcus sp. CA040A TaxID=2741738 RepID=UPI00157AA25D|nr:AraC family transcriptional regulator [Myxococcus sp. CA040A]NTX04601.1 AraC family transcriptional regulator [Myxococcus sp. CA040A]